MRIFCSILMGIFMGGIVKVASLSFISTPATEVLSIVYHLVVYLILGILLRAILASDFKAFPVAYAAFFIVICIGAGDEFLQSYIPGRDSSAMDWLLDAVGALFGTSRQFRYETLAFWIEPKEQETILYRRDV